MKNFSKVFALTVLPVLVVWAPFYLHIKEFWSIPIPTDGMQTIASNYDGPLYIVIAKSFYNIEYIANNFAFPLPLEYYAAHFPLFPVIISALSIIFGHPWGMLVATLLGSFITLYYFFKLSKQFLSPDDAWWLTTVFAVFPARWLIVRSVGSPEPLFVGGIIASIFYFRKKKYWHAGIWGAVAQLTKSPGILLFVAYIIVTYYPKLKIIAAGNFKRSQLFKLKPLPILLIPLSLAVIFWLYSVRFGSFFAYFNSGDNIHLFFPPFQIFDYSQPWVDTHWLEEIIFIYIFGAMGTFKLFKEDDKTLAWFTAIFFTTILFVSHRDILRYSLPIVPFILIAYRNILVSREFKFTLAIIIIPIYLYSLAFIANNVMPIADWTPLL
ncbi:MAG: hypothetical protein UV74_C0013G0396 [Candidatus Woesebacteria bacterium GW2011_GWB1_43_14]|uniref:Glycosyltransferase RgtA/B/C/D-like domain-containing protein n=1 Tax=Candidatus Woesebacteria bacterium GW2011_GWB1_43_14 TaxID=1618578 RepID=A0A0G1DHV6_9BACT|nr:MAG: hypothetical protein UT21_C0001G0108 [Candidatus Woesebacteria bacterium GW2011_GWA1_39_11b]KKS78308.1 MAG: hypothetical protein UV51_C0001G0024 [Candidatus Woesebacteria bacterium GW2011_GWC1_42_9]KKS97274.1 MAG: hypothetical protein UV74_C0013G0396 [Candidatus Woesebacteria bacterium GW2011_GWB1_43_14]